MSKKKDPRQMKTEVMDITPTLAAEWLKRNPGNRGIKPAKIDAYVRAMRAGRWRLTHQGIAFDRDDNLVDGQNRLHAVVLSGCTVRMMVTWNLVRDDMMVMDTGSSRHPGDMLTIVRGVGRGKARVAVVRILLAVENGKDTFVADDLQIIEECERHGAAFDWFYSIKGCAFLSYAPYMAALIYAWERRPQEVNEFAQFLIEPVGQSRGSVVLATIAMMRRRDEIATKGGSSERVRAFRMMLRAAMAYIKGETMAKIQDGDAGLRYFSRQVVK